MRKRTLLAIASLLGVVVADTASNRTCEVVPNLPQCADTCLSELTATTTDCAVARLEVCTHDYPQLTTCYEGSCGLADYLYAMNYTNTVCEIAPRHRETTQIAVGSVFISLTSIAVLLRLLGRSPFSDSFGVDDILALIGFAASMGDTIMMLIMAKSGWGTDMWALSQAQIIDLMKFFYIGIILFYFSVGITKIAILFFYLRIFTARSFKRQTYIVIALCTAYWLAAVLQTALNCLPPSFYWTRFAGETHGTCMSYAGFRAVAPISLALDVIVMVLPLPSIFGLNLPFAKKIRVVAMFCIGILILIAGTLRLTHLYKSITTYNITYNGGELSYYGVIESDVSVICTCMPPIAIFLKRILPRWFGSSVDRGYQTYTYKSGDRDTLRKTTYHTSVISTGHTSAPSTNPSSEDDIRLIDVLADERHIQRPGKVYS